MSERGNENERFGSLLFNESAMKRYISGESLDVWRECVRTRTVLPEKIAADIADGMKRWALEKARRIIRTGSSPCTGRPRKNTRAS